MFLSIYESVRFIRIFEQNSSRSKRDPIHKNLENFQWKFSFAPSSLQMWKFDCKTIMFSHY